MRQINFDKEFLGVLITLNRQDARLQIYRMLNAIDISMLRSIILCYKGNRASMCEEERSID